MKSRTQKAFLNMSTSLLAQIATIVCGLITPRLILTNFGSTYNGVTASATQFLNMLNILTLGITGATRVALYKPLAENDNLGVSRLMKASKIYMRKVALCVVAMATVLCAVYPLIAENDLSWSENAALIAIVSIGSFTKYFFGLNNTLLLQAAQSTYISNIGEIFSVVINTISVAILVNVKASIYTVKLGSSIIYLIIPLLISLYIHKKFSLTNKCEPDNSGINGRKSVALHSVANMIHDNVDLITLTFFVSSKMISVYTVYYTVVSRIKTLLRVFTSGMEAAFGDMWVKKEYKTLSDSFRTYEYMMFTLTALIFSCVGVLLLPFVRVYTIDVTDVNYILPLFAILITIAEGIHCIRQPYMTLIYATGCYRQTQWVAIAEATINLVISLTLVSVMGISGVIVGTLVSNAFCTVMFIWYTSKNILNRALHKVFLRVLWLLGCVGITVFFSNLISSYVTFEVAWIGWITQCTIVFGISIISTLIMSILFYGKDFLSLLNFGLRVIKKEK